MRAAAFCYAAITVLYVFPILSPEHLQLLGEGIADAVLVSVTLVAIRYRLGGIHHIEERRFWNCLSAALLIWLANGLAAILIADAYWTTPLEVGTDVGYLFFYVFIFVGITANPHLPSGWSVDNARYRLEATAMVAFASALFVYFAIIPSVVNRALYETYVPSMLFYVLLDALLVLAFLWLHRIAEAPRWRGTYGWLALAAALWGTADTVEGLMYMGVVPEVPSGTALDYLWFLPFVPMIMARRGPEWAFPAGGQARSAYEAAGETSALHVPIVLYAAALPIIHVALHRVGNPGEETRLAREVCVLLFAVVLAGIAVLHHHSVESERAEAERRKGLTEGRFRELFEEPLSGNYVSRPDGTLVACNQEFARIFAFESVEEAMSSNTAELYASPMDRASFVDHLREHGGSESREWTLKKRDGSEVSVLESVVGVFDAGGDLVEIRGQLIDVTASKELQRQLLHAQRLESIGLLAAGVAHDFNNILTGISGHLHFAMQSLPDTSASAEDLGKAQECVDRAVGLTRQLLAFSRSGPIDPTVFDLNEEVLATSKLLRPLIGEQIQLRVETAIGPATVRADIGELHQVLMNLTVNARDAMPSGGTITMRISKVNANSARLRDRIPPGDYIELIISDTGGGMDQATQERIFEPFFTTKQPGAGTGLGLSVVYGIIQRHDGHIFVDSVADEGTAFSIYLPPGEADDGDVQATAPARQSRASAGGRILVVEDESFVREIIERVLKQGGYQVVTAASADEGEALLADRGETIDLLVTDIVMPGRTGVEMYARIRGRHPRLPVLFMSAYADKDIFVKSELGTDFPFLRKPFDPPELVDKVRELLALNPGPPADHGGADL
jgi:PAS domain S-box-containing protein